MGTKGAACFDFTITRIERFGGNKAKLFFGLACEFPEGYVMTIQPRSSFCHKGWVQQNSPGQVDSDYRGELQMYIEAIPQQYDESAYSEDGYKITGTGEMLYTPLPFKVGDRCCQAKLEEVIPVEFEEVEELSDTERGAGGYGSTGK
jgi:dUTP pyrophosphatase